MKTKQQIEKFLSCREYGNEVKDLIQFLIYGVGVTNVKIEPNHGSELTAMEFMAWFNSGEFYTPKEGEFVWAKGNFDGAYICSSEHYRIFEEGGVVFDGPMDIPCDMSTIRPATEQEKQKLIKAVEAKYKKTWNGSEWVDIWRPKEGEIVAMKDSPNCVFAWRRGEFTTSYYVGVTSGGRVTLYPSGAMSENAEIIPANEAQKKRFIDALAQEGKRWNEKTLELEDILKEGDFIIAYSTPKPHSALIIQYRESVGKLLKCLIPSLNIIKWDGTKEQYERVLKGGVK